MDCIISSALWNVWQWLFRLDAFLHSCGKTKVKFPVEIGLFVPVCILYSPLESAGYRPILADPLFGGVQMTPYNSIVNMSEVVALLTL